jgi:uncharacterized membrane protein YesL
VLLLLVSAIIILMPMSILIVSVSIVAIVVMRVLVQQASGAGTRDLSQFVPKIPENGG